MPPSPTLHNLGMVWMAKGDLARAERLQREVLSQRRRLHPDGKHTDVALVGRPLQRPMDRDFLDV
jgi:hypothetical protein